MVADLRSPLVRLDGSVGCLPPRGMLLTHPNSLLGTSLTATCGH